jgi:flagellar hook protein FlgE
MSGQALLTTAGSGRTGNLSPSSLEMSNVDLAEEFVKMISTQRAFQANSRVITSSDEILQELMNIKR